MGLNRKFLDQREIAHIPVEKSISRESIGDRFLTVRSGVKDAECPVALRLRRERPEDVVKQGGHDHQDDERETDGKEADQCEELPSQENLERDFNIVFEHGLLL